QLRGLPFQKPRGGWIALGLGFLGGFFVVGYARREEKELTSTPGTAKSLRALETEREALFNELTALEKEWEAENIDEIAYETQTWLLRERLALVLKKIDDLRAKAA
ncbi:MAG: hypothetical protein ACNA8W_22635, partial [Bradymonadaceae bacterium]